MAVVQLAALVRPCSSLPTIKPMVEGNSAMIMAAPAPHTEDSTIVERP